jgi:hypothetical protein
MNYRPYLAGGLSGLLLFVIGSKIKAADAPAGETADQAIIYFSSAPWDGAAYSILIPLGHRDDAIQPIISINIWGYPQFPGPETIHFSGKEDSGGGPSKGDGRALFKPNEIKQCRCLWQAQFHLRTCRTTNRFQVTMSSQPWMGK